jgi:broad specificity phosphatase PhoE
MLQTIWIARHGNRLDFVAPEWFNTAKRRYDPPLSEDGIIQAKELAKRLKSEKIAHIFTSPFLRTIQTAYEVAEILDLPIKIEAGLSEWLNPDWMSETPETHPLEELSIKYPRIDGSYTSRLIPEYPENEATVNYRCAEIARILVKEFKEDILLLGHGASVIGSTRGLVGGNLVINASLCCLVKVVGIENQWQLQLNGDTSHLSQPQTKMRFN